MADETPVRDLILQRMETALLTIRVANGYQVDVREASRVVQVPPSITKFDAIYIIERGDQVKHHIKLALEIRMQLELACFTREWVESSKLPHLGRLMADVKKLLYVDETWDQLAVKTNVTDAGMSATEAAQPLGVNRIGVEVLFREVRGNPYAVRRFN